MPMIMPTTSGAINFLNRKRPSTSGNRAAWMNAVPKAPAHDDAENHLLNTAACAADFVTPDLPPTKWMAARTAAARTRWITNRPLRRSCSCAHPPAPQQCRDSDRAIQSIGKIQ
jgi:hypothetical protein